MNSADLHVYYDELKSTNEILENYILESGNNFIVLSSPCTSVTEPKKSRVAYFAQHLLSNFKIGQIFQRLISKSFYNKNDKLKLVFRLFSKKFGSLEKISCPGNSELLEKFYNVKKIKLWCWINPKSGKSKSDISLLENQEFYGIKFHMFWHSLTIKDIRNFLHDNTNIQKPIYLVLDWVDIHELERLFREFNHLTWIIGYGGFPVTRDALGVISKLDNIHIDMASFHISRKWIKEISLKVDEKKILYSTDFPYNFDWGSSRKFSTELFDNRLSLNGINVLSIRENSFNLDKYER